MQSLVDLPLIGGSPALDFVNTAEQRGHPLAGDVLRTPEDLSVWGTRYAVLQPTADTADPTSEFARAIAARELLYRLFSNRVRGAADEQADLDRLAQLTADAARSARLHDDGDGLLRWHFNDNDLTTVRHLAILSALELLTTTGTARLKQCPGDHCGWFFLDTTKRGNRRWCSMTDCGQAAKSAGRRRGTQRSSTA